MYVTLDTETWVRLLLSSENENRMYIANRKTRIWQWQRDSLEIWTKIYLWEQIYSKTLTEKLIKQQGLLKRELTMQLMELTLSLVPYKISLLRSESKYEHKFEILKIFYSSSQLLVGSFIVLSFAFLAMICCCLCPSSCCALSILKSVKKYSFQKIVELHLWIARFAVVKGHAVVMIIREILEHHRNTVTNQYKYISIYSNFLYQMLNFCISY